MNQQRHPPPSDPQAPVDTAVNPPCAVFTTPPLCAAGEHNIVAIGCNVVATYLGERKVHGRLGGIPPAVNRLTVETKNASHPLSDNYEQLKMITLPDSRRWRNLKSFEFTALVANAAPQQFLIHFIDGDQLQGKTLGFNIDRNGLYLYPTLKRGAFYYVFIPHHAVEYRQIGPKIGEQLIEDHAVSAARVEQALADQRSRRSKPLGEYLVDNAVVTAVELEAALERQRSTPEMKIGELLVRENLITEVQLDRALQAQKTNRAQPLGAILIERGDLTVEQLHVSLASKLGIPFVDLGRFTPDPAALAKLPADLARRYDVVALHFHAGKLVVALSDPMDVAALDAVRSASAFEVIAVTATLERIRNAIDDGYAALSENPGSHGGTPPQ